MFRATLPIVLDGNLISAPHLEDEFPAAKPSSAGNFTFKEVQDLFHRAESRRPARPHQSCTGTGG